MHFEKGAFQESDNLGTAALVALAGTVFLAIRECVYLYGCDA
ncbi:MAG: hypothetical protein V7784_18845 [Oceanospirillaceae bacterium]